MKLGKSQWLAVVTAAILFAGLYWGLDIKPDRQKQVEKTRALSAESTDIAVLLRDARQALSPADAALIDGLDAGLAAEKADTARIPGLQQLAGAWYNLKRPDISGYYAEQIAQQIGTAETWSIAGTTYTLCVRQADMPATRDFCVKRAVQAFENAISLEPDSIAHRVNLALLYTETAEPMKGIQMLLGLNDSNPDNEIVLFQLGRLAIQSGQYDRAVERLEKVLQLKPDNSQAPCLLVQAYEGLQQNEKAALYRSRCLTLTGQQ